MRTVGSVLILALTLGVLLAAPAAAAVVTTTVPITGTFASPCTGELIAFSGNMNVLIGQLADATGSLELTVRSNFQGVTGTGVLTGNQYQIGADIGRVMTVGLPPVSTTQSNDFRVVGSAGNFSGSFPLTVTISTTGGVSASAGPLQLTCN
jgi:hypothetical protein